MNENNSYLLEKILDSSVQGGVSIISFIINLALALILSSLISFVYTKYGSGISNRREFSANFPLLSMTTVLIISVVKSSLALSLGLVGALSIIRFRSAIKDPEELIYIFFSMAIGLGLGANQTLLTLITTVFISLFIIIRSKRKSKDNSTFISLMISYHNKNNYNFDNILELIKEHSLEVNLRRYSENDQNFEAVLNLYLISFNKIKSLIKVLSSKFPNIEIDFVDSSLT